VVKRVHFSNNKIVVSQGDITTLEMITWGMMAQNRLGNTAV